MTKRIAREATRELIDGAGRIEKHCMRGALGLLVGAALLVASPWTAAYQDYLPGSGENPVCALCHNCDFPTGKDLCLHKKFCMRSTVKNGSVVRRNRGIIVLDELEKTYDPVHFDHENHAQMSEMSGGCENCHHFVPPSSGHPACKECHAPEAQARKIQPALKAAYHLHCLGCHSEWDTDTHCELCHRKKAGGMSNAEYAKLPDRVHRTPLKVKDLILFKTNHEGGDTVPFHHRNHVEKYDRDCSVCHQGERCVSCHVHGSESHPLGLLSDIDLHDTCYKCHDKKKGCEECHGRSPNDLFDHASTGWELQPYHRVLQCKRCHATPGKYNANDPRCGTCHYDGWDEKHFNHGVTGVVLDEVHGEMDCTDCHVRGVGTRSDCNGCHDDGRKWTRHGSFGPGID